MLPTNNIANGLVEIAPGVTVTVEVWLQWRAMPRQPNTVVTDADRAQYGDRVNWRYVRRQETARAASTAATVEAHYTTVDTGDFIISDNFV